ncbi:hypothetical protein QEZ54_19855 [Catellatospora sp. KI3]|uniref:hypothetical protein n=1 Tax=Catellatospora sp. KI3 TaxID=3041620 RepID=UPI002482476C|nr:hypothetical protein [Catellatospora sp. KI3]MDI1463240.1 hypothetical protein [Catellatospora sp. KI3]
MSESRPASGEVSKCSLAGSVLGTVLGVAGDVVLWFWMTGGPLVDGLARARHNYAEVFYVEDIEPRYWYSLALAVAMTLAGTVLVLRRITSVGGPLLVFGTLGLAAVVGCLGLLASV